MNREIKSGELVGIFCKYSYTDTIPAVSDDDRGIVKNGTEKMDTPIHEDLKKAFKDIIPHFVLLCEQLNETKEIRNAIRDGIVDEIIPTTSIFYPYNVDKFEIKGSGNNEGVSFKGSRILTNGSVLKLETDKIKWESDDYPFISELSEAVEALKEETYQYTQGKQAPPPPDPQQGMDFDNADMIVVGADDTGDI